MRAPFQILAIPYVPGELPGTIINAPTPVQDSDTVTIGTSAKVNGKEMFSAVNEPEVYRDPHALLSAADTVLRHQHSAIPLFHLR